MNLSTLIEEEVGAAVRDICDVSVAPQAKSKVREILVALVRKMVEATKDAGEIQEIELRFEECSTCLRKPGSPVLCPGCLWNRHVIEKTQVARREQEERLKDFLK